MKKIVVSFTFVFLIINSLIMVNANLIDNSGFEDELQGWELHLENTLLYNIVIDTNISKSGDNSLKIDLAGVNNTSQETEDFAIAGVKNSNSIKLKKKQDYELEFYIKTTSDLNTDNYAEIKIILYESQSDFNLDNRNNTEIKTKKVLDLEKNKWEKEKIKFKTSSDNVYLRVFLTGTVSDKTCNSTIIWFDSVNLEKEDDDDCKDCDDNSNKKSVIKNCLPNWICTEWSSCNSGKKTRACKDENHCEFELNKPVEKLSCVQDSYDQIQELSAGTITLKPQQQIETPNNLLFWIIIIAIILVIFLIIIIALGR